MSTPEEQARAVRDMMASDAQLKAYFTGQPLHGATRSGPPPRAMFVVHPVVYWAVIGFFFGLIFSRDFYVLSVVAWTLIAAVAGTIVRYAPRLVRWAFGRFMANRQSADEKLRALLNRGGDGAD